MANSTRKRSVKSKTAPGRRNTKKTDRSLSAVSIGKYVLPSILVAFFLFAIGFFGLMGYRTVTASGFFEVQNVEVHGASRVASEDVSRIVGSVSTKTGAWNANLDDIRGKI